MGTDNALDLRAMQMLSLVYEYDFGSEYEYEISVQMFADVAHSLVVCVACA